MGGQCRSVGFCGALTSQTDSARLLMNEARIPLDVPSPVGDFSVDKEARTCLQWDPCDRISLAGASLALRFYMAAGEHGSKPDFFRLGRLLWI